MFSETVKRIERQYEIKRTQADALFIAEKKEIYDANPRLAELDKEITSCGIRTARLSLQPNSEEIQKEIKDLQNKILEGLNILR